MLITFNQMARFKPTTTAKRLKAYYHSQESRPAVFLSYQLSMLGECGGVIVSDSGQIRSPTVS